jgi:uncharacterized membrane protein YoaK (UPF0700 family)
MDRFDRSRQGLAISLAAVAGFVDAVGFLSADSYFVSFMSGNTTRLAVDLAQDRHAALTPALLILGFVTGVALGSFVAAKSGRWRKGAILLLVAVLLLAASLLHATDAHAASLGLLVLAMGAINNTFQRNGEIAVGLTYMTGALVRLGQAIGAALAGERKSGWGAYLLLWLGLASGGIAGAVSFLQIGPSALWIATGVVALMTPVGFALARREPS